MVSPVGENEPVIDQETPGGSSRSVSSGWSQLNLRNKILILVAPAILTAVAVNHQILASTEKINPWKGGGFGMFATVDATSERAIYAYGITRDGRIIDDPVEPGLGPIDSFSGPGMRAIALPDDEALRELAETSLAFQANADGPTGTDDEIVGIRIEVVTLHYDAKAREARVDLVRSYEVYRK